VNTSTGGIRRRVGLVLSVALFMAGCTGPPSATPPVPAPSSSASPSPSTGVFIPSLAGMQVDNARTQLDLLGLGVHVRTELADAARGEVLNQSPGPGITVDAGTRVTLTVARPLPRVPRVIGKDLETARLDVTFRGFKVKVERRETRSMPAGRVLNTRPRPGTHLWPKDTVTLIVAEAPPPPLLPAVTAICNDGTYSYSQHAQGTCSWHGGVRQWVHYPGT